MHLDTGVQDTMTLSDKSRKQVSERNTGAGLLDTPQFISAASLIYWERMISGEADPKMWLASLAKSAGNELST